MDSSPGTTIQILDEGGRVLWSSGEPFAVSADLWRRIRAELREHDDCSVRDGRDVVDAWLLRPADGGEGTRTVVRLRPRPAWMVDTHLTDRQREIAELASKGATSPEVARHLGLSPHTVRTHLRNIYQALGVANRLELARSLAFLRDVG